MPRKKRGGDSANAAWNEENENLEEVYGEENEDDEDLLEEAEDEEELEEEF